MFKQWPGQLQAFLWERELDGIPRWQRGPILVGRAAYRLMFDLVTGDIKLHAMSMVFTTLIAIVPVLAVSFSVLKGMGVHNQIEPLLAQFLAPLGEQGERVTDRIIGFVENMEVGLLGSVGLAMLFYSAFSLTQKVDEAFNAIWHIRHGRSLLRRMSDYLSVLLIGPVLVFSALGLSATLASSDLMQSLLAVEPFGQLYQSAVRLVPYLLIIAAFTFLYMFVPNTRVRFVPALTGGIVSGVIWQTTSWLFASFVATSGKYEAIYSGFAILIFFIIWVYLNWLILLVGADLVYHLQYRTYLRSLHYRMRLNIAGRERLAMRVLSAVGRAFYAGRGGASLAELTESTGAPAELIGDTLDLLEAAGLIGESAEGGRFLPARPFDATSVKHALDAIRHVPSAPSSEIGRFGSLDKLLEQADRRLHEVFDTVSLKQLALDDGGRANEPEGRGEH